MGKCPGAADVCPLQVYVETAWEKADGAMLDEELDEVIPMAHIGQAAAPVIGRVTEDIPEGGEGWINLGSQSDTDSAAA